MSMSGVRSLLTAYTAVLVLAGCGSTDYRAVDAPMTFDAAVDTFAAQTGSDPFPAAKVAGYDPKQLRGGVAFRVAHDRVERSIRDWHAGLLSSGAFVFRIENHFGLHGDEDVVVLFPTRDPYRIVDAVGVQGNDFPISHAAIVRWLKKLERSHPFVLTGASYDTLEGYFVRPVGDARALAESFYRVCPDIVDQGTETVAALADELRRTRTLFCWWD
jgi:hypothetical protein